MVEIDLFQFLLIKINGEDLHGARIYSDFKSTQ